jgi:hypothetical protein
MKFVNYTPLVMGALVIFLWAAWHLTAKKWFTGPKMTIDLPEGISSADEIALEHHGQTAHHAAPPPRDDEPEGAPA